MSFLIDTALLSMLERKQVPPKLAAWLPSLVRRGRWKRSCISCGDRKWPFWGVLWVQGMSQGTTRPPPDLPEEPFLEGLYSRNLLIFWGSGPERRLGA